MRKITNKVYFFKIITGLVAIAIILYIGCKIIPLMMNLSTR